MQSQTKIFSCRVRDVMKPIKVNVLKSAPCEDVIHKMARTRGGCVVISDKNKRLIGTLTYEDLVERVIFKVPPTASVENVMTLRSISINQDEYLYHAIGRMRRQSLSVIVVVNSEGSPVGLVELKDCFELVGARLIAQIESISAEGGRSSLKDIKSAQVALARDMMDDKVTAPEIQNLLSHINHDIYARLISANLHNMHAEGWGPPPVTFCVIVMGSGGRRENFLLPDQDNGFILEDYPDEDHNRIDPFFRELSERLCRDLNDVGFPYCKGHVMASNPLWRKTLSQWREQITLWGKKRNTLAIQLADIFFDFKVVWGDTGLGDSLRTTVLDQVRRNHFFLQEMYYAQADHSVALGLFGRFDKEPNDSANPGMIDLKYRAILPLVESIRLLSLKHGIAPTESAKRIAALHKVNILSDAEERVLSDALNLLTELLLFKQVEDFRKQKPVGRYINPKKLERHTRYKLKDALAHIDAFRKRLKSEFTGDVF